MKEDSFSERLQTLRIERRLTGRAFAKAAGLKPSTYQALTTGRSPTLDTLVMIASSLGVNIRWLATGEGPIYPAETDDTTDPMEQESSGTRRSGSLDPELLGRVVDRISKVYREEGLRLPDVDLGRLAAEKYDEIALLAEDPDEWAGFLEVMDTRVRKAIRAAAVDPANLKREA